MLVSFSDPLSNLFSQLQIPDNFKCNSVFIIHSDCCRFNCELGSRSFYPTNIKLYSCLESVKRELKVKIKTFGHHRFVVKRTTQILSIRRKGKREPSGGGGGCGGDTLDWLRLDYAAVADETLFLAQFRSNVALVQMMMIITLNICVWILSPFHAVRVKWHHFQLMAYARVDSSCNCLHKTAKTLLSLFVSSERQTKDQFWQLHFIKGHHAKDRPNLVPQFWLKRSRDIHLETTHF